MTGREMQRALAGFPTPAPLGLSADKPQSAKLRHSAPYQAGRNLTGPFAVSDQVCPGSTAAERLSAAALLILLLGVSPVYAQEASPALKITTGAFVAAQQADLALTTYLLAKSGDRYREANPLLRPFAHQPVTLAAVKSAASIGVSYALLKLGRSERKRTRVAALVAGIGLTAATSWVAHSNYQHYKREVAR